VCAIIVIAFRSKGQQFAFACVIAHFLHTTQYYTGVCCCSNFEKVAHIRTARMDKSTAEAPTKPTPSFSDRVSATMGKLLLSGYGLLDEYCETCQSPMMRDRENGLLCVACRTRDEDEQIKAHEAAQRVKREVPDGNVVAKKSKEVHSRFADSAAILEAEGFIEREETVTRRILVDKIAWAADKLNNTTDIGECVKLAKFMHLSAETIKTLDQLQ